MYTLRNSRVEVFSYIPQLLVLTMDSFCLLSGKEVSQIWCSLRALNVGMIMIMITEMMMKDVLLWVIRWCHWETMRGWGGERQLCASQPVKHSGQSWGQLGWRRTQETKPEELQRSLLKGVSFLNIYPDTDVISMRTGAWPTVEGHVTEWVGQNVKVVERAGGYFLKMRTSFHC